MTLIFKIHYFLWYGALTSIFGYEMVYARQYTNATTIQFGYLNMILPFVTVITTPFICSMADRHRNHRTFFCLSLISAFFSLALYALLPLLIDSPSYDDYMTQRLSTSTSRQRMLNNSSDLSIAIRPSEAIIIRDDNIRNNSNNINNTLLEDKGSLYVWPFIYFCLTSLLCDLSMGVANCLSDSFAVLQAEESGTNFGRIIVWGTFGWAASAMALCLINQWTLLPRLLPGILYGCILLTIDVVVVSFWPRNSDFKLDLIPKMAAQTLTACSTPSAHKDPSDYIPLNESAKVNMGTQVDPRDGKRHRKTSSPLDLMTVERSNSDSSRDRYTRRILHRISSHHRHKGHHHRGQQLEELLSSTPIESSITITRQRLARAAKSLSEKSPPETLATDSTIKTIDSHEAPDTKSNASYFSHVESKATKVTPDGKSKDKTNKSDPSLKKKKKNFENMIKKLKDEEDEEGSDAAEVEDGSSSKKAKNEMFATSFRMQITLLRIIMRKRPSLIRFFVLFIFAGFFMSMHWNYFFLYLEKIYEPQFELISALSMVSQSLIGELPFFILSRKFIDFFGRSHTISISIISIGLRFLLYGLFLPNVNMYFIIISDAFQGPNYGLFYVVMTEVGLEYSFCDDDTIDKLASLGQIDRNNQLQVDTIRLSLRSTVQSVAFACYEGLGVGLGSVFGGWLVYSHGFYTLWLSIAIASISIGILNSLVEISCWSETSYDQKSKRSPPLAQLTKLPAGGTLIDTAAAAENKQNVPDKDDSEPSDKGNFKATEPDGRKSLILVLKGSKGGSKDKHHQQNHKHQQHHHLDARHEFLQATRDGSIRRISTPTSFPAPIPMAPFKFQQPASVKLQLLMQRAKEASAREQASGRKEPSRGVNVAGGAPTLATSAAAGPAAGPKQQPSSSSSKPVVASRARRANGGQR